MLLTVLKQRALSLFRTVHPYSVAIKAEVVNASWRAVHRGVLSVIDHVIVENILAELVCYCDCIVKAPQCSLHRVQAQSAHSH